MHQKETKQKIERLKKDYFLRQCITGTLPHLTSLQRRILRMRIYYGLTLEEVSRSVGKTPSEMSYIELSSLRRLAHIQITKSQVSPLQAFVDRGNRNIELRTKYLSGEPLGATARKYGIKAETARQIAKGTGSYTHMPWSSVGMLQAAVNDDTSRCEEISESPIRRLFSSVGRIFAGRG